MYNFFSTQAIFRVVCKGSIFADTAHSLIDPTKMYYHQLGSQISILIFRYPNYQVLLYCYPGSKESI